MKNYSSYILSVPIILSCTFFGTPVSAQAEVGVPEKVMVVDGGGSVDEGIADDDPLPPIQLSEVLPNPVGSDLAGEFIEILNVGNEVVNLTGYTLSDASGRSTYTFTSVDLGPGFYHVIERGDDFLFALNNAEDHITLSDAGGVVIDHFSYISSTEGQSWNVDVVEWYIGDTTPGTANTLHPRTIAYPNLLVTELFPNPEGDETLGEFIEIYNPTSEVVSLEDWMIRDASLTGRHIFDDSYSIEPFGYKAVQRSIYTFALNNSGAEKISLTAPNGEIVDAVIYEDTPEGKSWNRTHTELRSDMGDDVLYVWSDTTTPDLENVWQKKEVAYLPLQITEILPNPEGDEILGEFIEIYNPHEIAVNLYNWILSDASLSGRYTFEEDFIVGPETYVLVPRRIFGFALNNSGIETVTLTTPSGDAASTISYEGSTEGISFAWDGSGFVWTSTPTPGATNVITSPDNEVKKKNDEGDFVLEDSYVQILLSEVLANPSGNESKDEFIELYNPWKVDISLRGWYMHDASKGGLYEFEDDAYVPANGYFTIFRPAYGFALNNTVDHVEIFNPRGEVSDIFSYKSTKEGVSHAREGVIASAVWRSTKYVTPGKVNIFDTQLQIDKLRCPDDVYRDASAIFSVETNKEGDDVKIRWDFGDKHRSYIRETAHTYMEKDEFTVTVRASDDVEEVTEMCEIRVEKYPKIDVSIVAIAPNPDGVDKGVEYIVIRNNEPREADLTGWSIATGRDKEHGVGHALKEQIKLGPEEEIVITYEQSAISLRNTNGFVDLRLPDGRSASDVEYVYTHAKSVPKDAVYRRTKNGWIWDLTQVQANNKKSQISHARAKLVTATARMNDAMRAQQAQQGSVNQRSKNHKPQKVRELMEVVVGYVNSKTRSIIMSMQNVDFDIAFTVSPASAMIPEELSLSDFCDSLVTEKIFAQIASGSVCDHYDEALFLSVDR